MSWGKVPENRPESISNIPQGPDNVEISAALARLAAPGAAAQWTLNEIAGRNAEEPAVATPTPHPSQEADEQVRHDLGYIGVSPPESRSVPSFYPSSQQASQQVLHELDQALASLIATANKQIDLERGGGLNL